MQKLGEHPCNIVICQAWYIRIFKFCNYLK